MTIVTNDLDDIPVSSASLKFATVLRGSIVGPNSTNLTRLREQIETLRNAMKLAKWRRRLRGSYESWIGSSPRVFDSGASA